MDDRTERIKKVIRYLIGKGIASNQLDLGNKLGFTNKSYFSQLVNCRVNNDQFVIKLASLDENINSLWILSGEGEMLKTNSDSALDKVIAGKVIPFYDTDPEGGNNHYMNMDAATAPVAYLEIGGILKDSDCALRVYGNSMVPNYPAGCVVGLRRHTDSFIEPGQVYVIETQETRMIKRLFYSEDKKAIRCVSDNTMVFDAGPMKGEFCYQDFEIPISEVLRLYRVVGVIKRNVL